MKRIVKYTAINPLYSNIEQVYIGSSVEEIDNIQWETEEFMRGENFSLNNIYKSEVIKEDENYY